MTILDNIDLLYPNESARKYTQTRRKKFEDFPADFMTNLEVENVARLISPMNIGRISEMMRDFTDDVDTLNYRLDCLEDFINIPQLSEEF